MMDGSGSDNRSYKTCIAPVKLLPPTKQLRAFFTGRLPFLSPSRQCHSTEGKLFEQLQSLYNCSVAISELDRRFCVCYKLANSSVRNCFQSILSVLDLIVCSLFVYFCHVAMRRFPPCLKPPIAE